MSQSVRSFHCQSITPSSVQMIKNGFWNISFNIKNMKSKCWKKTNVIFLYNVKYSSLNKQKVNQKVILRHYLSRVEQSVTQSVSATSGLCGCVLIRFDWQHIKDCDATKTNSSSSFRGSFFNVMISYCRKHLWKKKNLKELFLVRRNKRFVKEITLITPVPPNDTDT